MANFDRCSMERANTQCYLYAPFLQIFLEQVFQVKQVFRVKKLVGRQWGAPNSNYLLRCNGVATFVMPFSITLKLDTHTSNRRTHAYTDTSTPTHRHTHTHNADTNIHTQTDTQTHTHTCVHVCAHGNPQNHT